MIPPGALEQNTTVSIAPVNQQNLSLPLPPGFEFAGAFNLNFSDNSLNIPAQLAVPAPAGLAPGTVAYFLRKGAIPDATGTWNPIWLQEESGIVGDDGNIRTQSPPYPGVVRPGEYAVVYSSPTGSATLVKGQLTLNYNFPLAFFGIIDPLGNIGQLIDPDKFVTTPAFTVTRDISSVQVVAIPKVGLPVVTEVGVQRNDDGTATFKAALNMPAPTSSDPTTPPVLQKAELKFKDENNQQFENNEPLLFLTGGNILVNNASDSRGSKFEDLTVKFYAGNSVYEGTVVSTRSRSLGGNQYEVAVKVPDTVVLGASGVVVERKQNQIVEQKGATPVYKEIQYHSNPIRLPQGAEYVFAALGGSDRVAVLNGKSPESVVNTTNSKDLLLAQIPVGTSGVTDWAESTAVTSDGTRVYVVLRESGLVAMVDPMVQRQVDTQPNTPGVNPIVLPAGAKPRSIAIDPKDNYAYIADRDRSNIYVLDIDPFSATYHQVIQTVKVGSSTTTLRNLAISSDGRKLFATASDNYIYAVNIDPKDRPNQPNSNPRKWHEQIGAVAGALGPTGPLGVTGLAATSNPKAMIFTSGNTTTDGKGYGVLEFASDDPLNFTATNRYIDLSLGSANDYFDVNEGVSVTVMRDGRYAFVAGRNNRDNVALFPDPRSGSNIGIIKDPLGPNPQLVAATRPIPGGLTNDLVLSNDNKSLFSSYPAPSSAGSVYVFNVEEIIKTLDNPGQFKIDSLDRGVKSPFFNAPTARSVTGADFTRVPIDDINPAISIAADYGITKENRPANQFTYGVLPGTTRAPIGTGGNLRDLSIAPTDWLNLKGPGATTSDLTPTFQWQFAPGWEDVKEVNLFVSTFDQGKGLLPWDKVVNLSDSALLPGFSETQKRQLLSKPWNGYDDFNPNRILTATWKKDTGKWYGHDGITPLNQPLNDPANTSTNFTLPRSLTAGQNYNFAVEAVSNSGAVTKDLGQFQTLPPDSNSPFSSVSVLTHGFTLLPNQSGIPDSFFQMANKIATVSGNTPENSGLIMRYDKPTGNWIPIDLQGRVITELTGGLNTSETAYLSTLANNLKKGVVIDGKEIKYLNNNKPLVLLTEWSLDRESVIPDVGFSEGAADAIFASMVQLDLALGGKVGEYENNQLKRLYDNQGKLIRTQGDLFNSPMHFMGFSRGTVVNSEIVQRLGTFFPEAGGVQGSKNRDLQMTTIDPHDFYQPSLNLRLPGFISTNFSDFYEPKVQVWNNVTFADNYYQTVADPIGLTATPNGRSLAGLPIEELNKNPKPAGLNFPKANGDTLGKADREILLGTRNGEPDRISSRIGFTKDDDIGGTHKRAWTWYAGTVDLDLDQVKTQYPHASNPNVPESINDQLGERDANQWFDPNFPAAKPWYDNASGEGIGEGWFYSVLGGGKDQRQYSPTGRVPVSFDNTLEAGMRGDYAVPTLFNGNFDQFIPNKSEPEKLGRNAISQEIPGWSFHGGTSTLVSPINNLVEWSQIAQQSPNFSNYLSLLGINSQAQNYQPNYALKLGAGESITHNRFVVPDWGVLRLDIHVPESSLNKGGRLKVYLEEVGSPENVKIGEISLEESEPTTEKATRTSLREPEPDGSRKTYEVNIPGNYGYDKDTIGYGSSGFETFHIDVPPSLRGKVAKLTFELQGAEPVYIDNAFFKSEVLKWGNPTEARNDLQFENNFLIEKPQYTLSYNLSKNTVNWVGWKLDKTWLGDIKRPQFFGFAQDPELVKNGWYSVKDSDYDALYLKDKDGQVVDNRKGDRYADGYVDFEIDENGNYIPILGIDRGHMAPAADRNRTAKDLYATFLTTNLLPQESSNNRGIWETIENQVRAVIRNSPDSSGLETYMFAGGYGYYDNPSQRPYTGISQNSNLNPLIQFPVGLWKVVMTKDKNTELPQYAHYGIYLGNDARSGYQKQTIQNLEDLLNGDLPGISPQYQFLSNLPESPGKERIKNTIFERLP
ncbi:DNA/RNA non-specific endonuclease [Microcoleus sp.]|uniref:DNA/RNA non-specific endonuclease n=1 Tax=Microcoleus sp. TaxID=44472 RepID=UPI00352668A9